MEMAAIGTPVWMILIHWIARLVLLVLLGLSVWSISIMLDRYRYFIALKKARVSEAGRALLEQNNLAGFSQWATQLSQQTAHPTSLVLLSAVGVAAPKSPSEHTGDYIEAVDRSVRSAMLGQKINLDSGLTVLATLGSNAPFIGLFGTVLGIIEAFGQLSSSQAGTQGVVGGISEALIATAIGLFVAIPAVVAYNVFSKWAKDIQTDIEILRDLYVSRVLSGLK